MDPEEANKFIKAVVKNLQLLCHNHFNFNSSMQVIGHLYLNMDSDVNIDYILNEKVVKNDSKSTVFVSKSYHSEPKDKKPKPANTNPQKPIPEKKQVSQPYHHHGNLNSERVKFPRRRFEPSLQMPNVNPSFKEDRFSGGYQNTSPPQKIPRMSLSDGEEQRLFKEDTFSGYQNTSPPQKMPRMSVSDGEEQRLFKSDVKTKIVTHGNQTVNVIDLSDVKDEPDEELDDQLYDASEDDKEEIDMPHGEGTSADSFSENIPIDPATAASMALHLNQNFPPFQDPNNSSSSSPYGGGGDSQMSQDPNVKNLMEDRSRLFPNKVPDLNSHRATRAHRPMLPETYETIVSLLLGTFNTPVLQRTRVQKSAVVKFWRGKGKYSMKEINGVPTLFYDGQPVLVQQGNSEHFHTDKDGSTLDFLQKYSIF